MGFLEDTVETLPVLLNGTVIAVELFAIVLVLSLPLGLPIAFGENSKIGIIRWLCRAYVFVFRGTPLLLQLFFFYYFFPIALHVQMSAFPTAVLTFTLNYAAYFAEIYRGGINSICVGQYEASRSLGLSKWLTTVDIVIPQMMKVVLPPVSNEIITLIKDTSLASVLALGELMKVSQGIVNRTGNLGVYLIAAIIYLIFTFVTTLVLNYVEKRYSRFDREEE